MMRDYDRFVDTTPLPGASRDPAPAAPNPPVPDVTMPATIE